MPSNVPSKKVTAAFGAVQYDGTNAAFIAGCFDGGTVVGTPGTTCVIDINGSFNIEISTGDWVAVSQGGFYGRFTPAQYAAAWTEIYSASQVTSLTAPVNAIGIGTVPTLGANAQATVHVELSADFGGTSYSAAAALHGGTALLGALTILSTTKVDGNTVDVVVKNTGLASLSGAGVFVVASA